MSFNALLPLLVAYCRRLVSRFRSDIFRSRYTTDGGHKGLPDAALRGQRLLAVFRQFVKTSPPLPGFLHPAAFDPAALFQPVKQEIKRGGVELQHAVRARLDQLADLVTMARAGLQQRQDEQFGAALLQLAVDFLRIDSWHNNILCNKLYCVKRNPLALRQRGMKC